MRLSENGHFQLLIWIPDHPSAEGQESGMAVVVEK